MRFDITKLYIGENLKMKGEFFLAYTPTRVVRIVWERYLYSSNLDVIKSNTNFLC